MIYKVFNSRFIKTIAVLLIGILNIHVLAQEGENKSFGLFEKDEILNISLAFDIGKYIEEKFEENLLDAEITIYTGETDSIFENIKVRSRGNFRRSNCSFPPIMLHMKDMETGYSDLDDLGKVKLVSHCKDENIYDTYLFREYLIYKIYNVITDYSFRVRLLNIDYYDINYDILYVSKRGFIIEPVNNLEDRFAHDEIEEVKISGEAIENDLMLKLSLFQYMIANSDWYLPIMHNLKIFGDKDVMMNLIAVPYDFDYTGWVNTHYAYAREELGLEDIRDRAFFGPCRNEEEYRLVLDYYLELEDNIIDTVKDFKYLKGPARNDLIRYVKSFYRLYKGDEIMNICMKPCNN